MGWVFPNLIMESMDHVVLATGEFHLSCSLIWMVLLLSQIHGHQTRVLLVLTVPLVLSILPIIITNAITVCNIHRFFMNQWMLIPKPDALLLSHIWLMVLLTLSMV